MPLLPCLLPPLFPSVCARGRFQQRYARPARAYMYLCHNAAAKPSRCSLAAALPVKCFLNSGLKGDDGSVMVLPLTSVRAVRVVGLTSFGDNW
jgi:hypothetical protein